MIRANKQDVIIGLIILILSIIFLFFVIPHQVQKSNGIIALSPRLFCQILTGIMIFLSSILVIKGIVLKIDKYKTNGEMYQKRELIRVIISVCAAFIYLLLITGIGYIAATIVILLFFSIFFGARNWVSISIIIVVVIIFTYLFFEKALQVVLPRGMIF